MLVIRLIISGDDICYVVLDREAKTRDSRTARVVRGQNGRAMQGPLSHLYTATGSVPFDKDLESLVDQAFQFGREYEQGLQRKKRPVGKGRRRKIRENVEGFVARTADKAHLGRYRQNVGDLVADVTGAVGHLAKEGRLR